MKLVDLYTKFIEWFIKSSKENQFVKGMCESIEHLFRYIFTYNFIFMLFYSIFVLFILVEKERFSFLAQLWASFI